MTLAYFRPHDFGRDKKAVFLYNTNPSAHVSVMTENVTLPQHLLYSLILRAME